FCLGSAVADRVGLWLEVRLVPVGSELSAKPVITGAFGAVWSIEIENPVEAELVLSGASVALAVKLYEPSPSAPEVKVKVTGAPVSFAELTDTPSGYATTPAPASAVTVWAG